MTIEDGPNVYAHKENHEKIQAKNPSNLGRTVVLQLVS